MCLFHGMAGERAILTILTILTTHNANFYVVCEHPNYFSGVRKHAAGVEMLDGGLVALADALADVERSMLLITPQLDAVTLPASVPWFLSEDVDGEGCGGEDGSKQVADCVDKINDMLREVRIWHINLSSVMLCYVMCGVVWCGARVFARV